MRILDDYRCQECGRKEERLAKRDEDQRCECGGKMVRVIGTPAGKVFGGYSERMMK